jgi:hypothetical protein
MKRKTDEYQTIRIWVKTQQRLKLIAALRHESLVQVLEHLSVQELARLQAQEKGMGG